MNIHQTFIVYQSAASAGEPPKNVNSGIELVSEGEAEDEEEDESDSDIEFVIETEPGKRALPPPSVQLFTRMAQSRLAAAAKERSASSAAK